MQISRDFLNETFEVVRLINSNYSLYALDSKTNIKSTDFLRDICEHELQKKISFKTHMQPFCHGGIKGFNLFLNDGSYEIVIMPELNYCWNRLVLCKELFHVVLDNEEHRHDSVDQLLKEVSAQLNVDKEIRPAPSKAMQTEPMAEIAAMEFLFPYSERRIIIDSGKINFDYIAHQYKIPLQYVEMYLSESYMNPLKEYCLD
ncbi:hypothetical protein C8R27_14114 [Nitrosomonas ureae]|uniref:hypothetical protein n=1 Tax=Nitrosomonas ureae TaxID=44577 RepID=UPI000D76A902|nr:hypothetical protein [Nitrosomonas ureae]PXX08944.1 hypothetical protein C8R27_14114 [Nitrosomonas ureae]